MKVDNSLESQSANWNFSGSVPDTFVDHITKSVPGYVEGHEIACYLSDFFCRQDSVCYEIGCSTGELLNKLAVHNKHKPEIQWIGIDTEEHMIQKANKMDYEPQNMSFIHEDVRAYDLEKSDFIVSYYTMQFIPPRYRQRVFDKIYQSLNWGGALVLFEKVRGPDARFQDMMTTMYNDFKIRQGFSHEEILNKTSSLKSVMEPFSTQGNYDLLERAGFKDYMTIFKNICFEGIVAIK